MGLEILLRVRRGNSEKADIYGGATWEEISDQIKNGVIGECLFAGSEENPAVVTFMGEICRIPDGGQSLLIESGA